MKFTNTNEALSLYELSRLIHQTIDAGLNQQYLVTAEIQSLSVNRSGHAYLELVEKSDTGQQIVSQMRATIWAGQYRTIRPYFETATGLLFQAGIKIMVIAKVSYHEIYGLSLNITDILPEYTAGELALQRKKTIEQLKNEGVFDMNHELELPMLIKNIAVISSAGAAGYGDFVNQLRKNPYHYGFLTTLFEATMQGNQAEPSIIEQLDKIASEPNTFDCVVIIRGGGSKTDLGCFDNLTLCRHICQYPLPIITGIGHERDESVADLVANTRQKTPTAVAQFLIDRALQCDRLVDTKLDSIRNHMTDLIRLQQTRIHDIENTLTSVIRNFVPLRQSKTENCYNNIIHKIQYLLANKKSTTILTTRKIHSQMATATSEATAKLEKTELKAIANSPETMLKKGYTYVISNGKIVTSPQQLTEGQTITTVFMQGTVDSIVTNKNIHQ